MTYIVTGDLAPFANIDSAKAVAMIEDSEAMAVLAAPCIATVEFLADAPKMAAVRAILRGAILRWDTAGSGAVTQHSTTAGPFTKSETIDTTTPRRAMFWPSEVAELRGLCGTSGLRAFELDTLPVRATPEVEA